MFNKEKYTEIRDFLQITSKMTEIIAISKNHPQESVVEAINAGVKIFGENRVIEAKNKFSKLKQLHPKIELHLTGPLQSNKVKQAISIFDVFHTLDREKIVKEFNKNIDLIDSKKFFVQVNTGMEDTKSGIYPKHLSDFLNYCRIDMSLKIVGLMCIPPINEDPKKHFKILKDLATENKLKEISIGMSGDYLKALEFNPRYIRLGTVLFGKRN